MVRKPSVPGILISAVLVAGLALAGCRQKETVPGTEMQSQTPAQATNQPTTVTGCLKAGDAAETYVLTSGLTTTGEQAATYHLVGVDGVNLSEHIGSRVEVSGTVRAQQEIATRSTSQPSGKPTGTGGTPTVSTQTDLEIKRLDVSKVRRVEGRCEM